MDEKVLQNYLKFFWIVRFQSSEAVPIVKLLLLVKVIRNKAMKRIYGP
jgi:hypothetical protein